MSERKTIAAALKSRKAFSIVEEHLNDGDFTEQGNVIWKAIREYYSRDAACGSVDPEILAREVARTLTSDKHKQTFETLIRELAGSGASPENVVHDFLAVKREAAGARLATAILSNQKTTTLVEEYSKWEDAETLVSDSTEESKVLVAPPLAEITKTYSEGELIKVWPTALNSRLDGGMLRGHHMVVFARPEMGKTLFLVNAVAGFLTQGLMVLYVGNEDPIQDIVLRVVCRLTKKSKFDVLANPQAAEKEALEKGYANLILAGLSPGTPKEIEELVEQYTPDVLLIDQLRNLSITNKDGNYVQQLEKAATSARNIGKRYGVLVISVTQAGDSASGKAVLEMGDVDSSNTGIPAQADVMVGIGASQEDYQMGRRVLSLPKNKRSGRHEFFPVRIDPTQSRIINLEDTDNAGR